MRLPGYLVLVGVLVFELYASRLVFELVRVSVLVGVFASESSFEPVDQCPLALVSLACLHERLAASPLDVARPRPPRLRELPLAYTCDPVALVSERIALISDRLTRVSDAVSVVRAPRPLF